jgi:ankyrin repeat protein
MSSLHDAIIRSTTDNDNLMRFFSKNKEYARIKDNDGNYPLYLACEYRHEAEKLVFALLKEYPEGIKQNGWEKLHVNPLHMACSKNRPYLVSLILHHNPSLLNSIHNNGYGQLSPLQIACYYGYSSIVDILLQYPHLDVNRTEFSYKRRTVLHNANWNITRKLLNFNGINVDVLDADNRTPFDRFIDKLSYNKKIQRTKKSRHYEVLRLYLTKFSWLVNKKYFLGYNLLHIMILRRHNDIFEELLPYASHIINDGDDQGTTPIHFACIMNCNEILKMLVENKLVNKNKKSITGYTALHYACYHHRVDDVKILIASPNVRKDLLDLHNEQPLQTILYRFIVVTEDEQISFIKSALVIFELMLDSGGEVYTKNKYGVTVLEEAIIIRDRIINSNHPENPDIDTSEWQESIEVMNQIVDMLESCDGKRKKVYNYLRQEWISIE